MKKKLFQQQVIYFPHKGLLHGKGLKKLFFHSNSINEFKKEYIIHIELHGSNYNDTYEELGIEPIQWNQISFNWIMSASLQPIDIFIRQMRNEFLQFRIFIKKCFAIKLSIRCGILLKFTVNSFM